MSLHSEDEVDLDYETIPDDDRTEEEEKFDEKLTERLVHSGPMSKVAKKAKLFYKKSKKLREKITLSKNTDKNRAKSATTAPPAAVPTTPTTPPKKGQPPPPVDDRPLPVQQFDMLLGKQEKLFNRVKDRQLDPLTAQINNRQNGGHKITLADYTRQLRLQRVLEVAEQGANLQRAVLKMHARQYNDNKTPLSKDVEAEFEFVVAMAKEEMSTVAGYWSHVKSQASLVTVSGVKLEPRIAALHDCVENILLAVRQYIMYLAERNSKGHGDQAFFRVGGRWTLASVDELFNDLPPKYTVRYDNNMEHHVLTHSDHKSPHPQHPDHKGPQLTDTPPTAGASTANPRLGELK